MGAIPARDPATSPAVNDKQRPQFFLKKKKKPGIIAPPALKPGARNMLS
jgi:hypothetical protein